MSLAFLTIILMLVILASIGSQWLGGAGRQVSQGVGLKRVERSLVNAPQHTPRAAVLRQPEDPPGGSHPMPVAPGQWPISRVILSASVGRSQHVRQTRVFNSAETGARKTHVRKGNVIRTGLQHRSGTSSDCGGALGEQTSSLMATQPVLIPLSLSLGSTEMGRWRSQKATHGEARRPAQRCCKEKSEPR